MVGKGKVVPVLN